VSLFLDLLAATLLVSGAVFTVVAALGVLRMEDVYVRMHASTKAGTLGLMLIVAALMLTVDSASTMEKGIALFLLVLATAPVSAHLVGRAVWRVMAAPPESLSGGSDRAGNASEDEPADSAGS
jgi:multicomponent Na+:H+ antiporter subunit G